MEITNVKVRSAEPPAPPQSPSENQQDSESGEDLRIWAIPKPEASSFSWPRVSPGCR